MKKEIYKLLLGARQVLFAHALIVFLTPGYSQTTYTFIYTGGVQTQNLQAGNYRVQCWGGNGGDNFGPGTGGIGGYSTGTINVPSSAPYYIYVGGKGITGVGGQGAAPGGFNGGGNAGFYTNLTWGQASGGGATHIASATGLLSTLSGNQSAVKIVAGGGGGAGYNHGPNVLIDLGGKGGGLTGGNGLTGTYGGFGGTQTAGGNNSTVPLYAGTMAEGGSFGKGGSANLSPSGYPAFPNNTGGGGGGGWYGGAAALWEGGGGGSGYIGGVINGITVQSGQPGFVPNPDITRNGYVIITALCDITLTGAGLNPICNGNSATLTTNAISNYAWSNGGNSSSIVVSPTVTTSYTLTATSPSNCTASAVITVSVDNTPTVTAVISPSVVCMYKPVTMTASGASSYAWTGGIINGVAYLPTVSGSFTYIAIGTNACGNSTAAVTLTVNSAPNITASINNPTVCIGSSIILNGFGSVSGYTWSAGVPNNTAFVPAATTNYIVTGVGSNGCTNMAAVGVTVLITPTITPVVTPTSVCVGGTATLAAVGATGYTWTPGSNLNTSTIAVSPPVTTTYTVVRTNGACSSTSTVSLVVFPLPPMNASATPSQICAGDGANLVVVGPNTNTWLPGGFTTANFTVYPNVSRNYTVTGSNGNCTASVVVQVIVNPTPIITISSSTNIICQGGNVTLTGSGGLTYTWQPMNTNNTIEIVSPPSTTIITLSGTNSFSCTATVNQLIQVYTLPNMNLTSSSPFICAGNTAAISITSPSSNIVYNWSTGAFGTSISVNPSVTTNYFATGTNTITGCINTNTIMLSVYVATFVVSSPTAICKGESATLTANGQATGYFWSANGGVASQSVIVSPLLSTTYSVTGTTNSCSSSTTVPIIVHSLPPVTAFAAKAYICRYEVSTIIGNGATSYSWNTGASTPTISFILTLTTTYTLVGTDVNGCSKTATVTQYVATCLGIEDIETNGRGLNIYPNPNNGTFIIESEKSMTLDIINTLGQVITTIKLSDGIAKEVTVDNLPTGIYFIRSQNDGLKINKKLIIER